MAPRQAGPPSLGPAGVAYQLELHTLLLAGMPIAYWALNAIFWPLSHPSDP